jgi:hypothetical protein
MSRMTFQDSLVLNCGIDAAALSKPIDKEWRGSAAHLGPHRYTPLRQSLEFKTSSALLSLMAASAMWAKVRYDGIADTAVLGELSEAILCYQASPLYLRPPRQEHRLIPKTDGMSPAEGAIAVFPWMFFTSHMFKPNRWPTYPPVVQTAQFIHLTRYLMPKRVKLYETWAEAVIEKLAKTAHLSDPRQERLPSGSPPEVYAAEAARVIGPPLSPHALDIEASFDADENARLFAEGLASVDWQANRFLRTPEEMRKLGFDAEPYSAT